MREKGTRMMAPLFSWAIDWVMVEFFTEVGHTEEKQNFSLVAVKMVGSFDIRVARCVGHPVRSY